MSSRSAEDSALSEVLDWALGRMRSAGYGIDAKVSLVVDPDLSIMGYARKDGATHFVVVAGWALDSQMLGGLVLHELSHVYHTEKGTPSHRHEIIEKVLAKISERDGLNEREREYLLDCFNHLQNIIVDDIVFQAMSQKELAMTQRFFAGWVSERPTGDPILDAALLCRNAFAVASLKRRKLYELNGDMDTRNSEFISTLGEKSEKTYKELETLLLNAKSGLSETQFRRLLSSYLEKVLSLMREWKGFEDLR